MASQAEVRRPAPLPSIDKWEALRVLSVIARARYRLNDRDISVLQALLSFHRETELTGDDPAALIVFPSNAALCERLNAMPCSTMRRHLARLVEAGLLIRRDSPNGKRFSRSSAMGRVAYGFDLRPLVLRHPEHCALAEEARIRQDRIRHLREQVSLMRRDLAGLSEWGRSELPDLTDWDGFDDLARLTARDLRRKLDQETLESLRAALKTALDQARDLLEPPSESPELSTTDVQIEQHHQSSKKEITVSEQAEEKERPALPLRMITTVCSEFLSFSPHVPRHWHEFVAIAETLRPMLGIAPDAWFAAKNAMGVEQASVVLAAMMQRLSEIRAPGAYLRHLTAKAESGHFSAGPMVRALMNRSA